MTFQSYLCLLIARLSSTLLLNELKTHLNYHETPWPSSSLPLMAGMICGQLSTQWRAAVVVRTWRRRAAMWLHFVLNYSSFSPSFCRHFSLPHYTQTQSPQHTFDEVQTFVGPISFKFTYLSSLLRISRSRSVQRLRAFRQVARIV